MVRYDLRNGIIGRKLWLILPMTFWSAAIIYISVQIDYSDSMTFGAGLFSILAGTMPVDISMKSFNIPAIWILLQIGSIFFTVEYATRDLSKFGQQIIIRGGKKTSWWLSKCLWCILSTMIYWGVGYLMTALYCASKGVPLTLGINGEFPAGCLMECDVVADHFSFGQMLLPLVAAPMLSAIVINMLQMFIAFTVNDILAVAFSIIYIVWSMCVRLYIAVGNFSMMQRCSVFDTKGLSFGKGMVVMTAMLATIIFIGGILFSKTDILEPHKSGV